MQVAVVYESLYGSTHEAADAVAIGVLDARPDATVAVVSVGEATATATTDVDLVIVGGPTHIRGMSTSFTRHMGVAGEAKKDPAERHALEPGAEGPGLRDWFRGLPKAHGHRPAAAFDTRIEGPMVGGAAPGIARRLRRHGYEVVAEPEGFHVQDDGRTLEDGERERARLWAADIVRRVAPVTSG
jgi:hypothetical protein